MQLQTLGADTPADQVVAALEADGAVIVHDLLPPEVVTAINAEVDPFVDAADPDMRHLNPGVQFFHAQTRHVSGLAGKSRTFATEVMIHPLLMSLCDTILGPSCARYQLNLAHLLERLPGAPDQFWHQDELVWNLVPEPQPRAATRVGDRARRLHRRQRRDARVSGQQPLGAGSLPRRREARDRGDAGRFRDLVSRFDLPRRRRAHRHGAAARRAPLVHVGLAAHRGEQLPRGAARDRVRRSRASARRCWATRCTTRSNAVAATSACSTCATRS